MITGQIRKKALRDMNGQGMGRHTLNEQLQMGADNLKAIADWLGDQPFMHGDQPTAVDASVGTFVAGIHGDGFDTALRQAARSHQNLGDYAARIKQHFYPEQA
jgi:glutathione S-transferase